MKASYTIPEIKMLPVIATQVICGSESLGTTKNESFEEQELDW